MKDIYKLVDEWRGMVASFQEMQIDHKDLGKWAIGNVPDMLNELIKQRKARIEGSLALVDEKNHEPLGIAGVRT